MSSPEPCLRSGMARGCVGFMHGTSAYLLAHEGIYPGFPLFTLEGRILVRSHARRSHWLRTHPDRGGQGTPGPYLPWDGTGGGPVIILPSVLGILRDNAKSPLPPAQNVRMRVCARNCSSVDGGCISADSLPQRPMNSGRVVCLLSLLSSFLFIRTLHPPLLAARFCS